MNLLLPFLLLAADTGDVRLPRESADQPPAYETQDRWLSQDKFQHAAMSYMITAGAAATARTIADRDESVLIGAAIGAAAGIAKEIYDRKSSMRDLVWDLAGIAAAVLITRNAR